MHRLVLLSAALAAGCAASAPPPAGPPPLEAGRDAGRVGGVEVWVSPAWVGPVRGTLSPREAEKPHLQIPLTLRNADPARRPHYRPWHAWARLADDRGNRYRARDFPSDDTPGRVPSYDQPALACGEDPVGDLLIFEPPVPGFAWLLLELPAENVGGAEGAWLRFRVPPSAVRLSPPPPAGAP